MQTAQAGNKVQVHYHGTLDDGSTFDSSANREPLEFTLGTGQVIQGFDEAVTGMQAGEKKTIRLPAPEAYGEHRAELVIELGREQIPADIELELGMSLGMQQSSGQAVPVIVTDLSDDSVTLDANHPLAGEALTFELELLSIV